MKILVIGPSVTGTRGGMASVINAMLNEERFSGQNEIRHLVSHSEGSWLYKLLVALRSYLVFLFTARRYDVMHAHAASGASIYRKSFFVWWCRVVGRPILLHIHGADFDTFYRELPPARKERLSRLFNRADRTIVLSSYWSTFFREEMRVENAVILKNGVDTAVYQPTITPYQPGKMLFLGRLGERKGVYDLLEVADRMARDGLKFRLHLAGDGEIEQVRRIIAEKNLGDWVIVEGWIDGGKKLELFRQVSVMVLPSYDEGLPVAIIEAMAAGKVIVSTTVGGIPELVENDVNGWLIQPGDLDALERCLRKTIDESLQDLCERNVEKIRAEYDLSMIHAQLLELYGQAVARDK